MKAIFLRELKGYYTTVTGFLFAAFLLLFTGIYTMAFNLSGGLANFEYVLNGITFIYLIGVPILTMRAIAEERRQKTDQLLYSLPISLSSVVLGKYLAMVTVLLAPTVIMAAYPLILSLFGSVHLPSAYCAIGGFFLMGAALLAIGLFISSVTENQIIAAVVCLCVMLLLYFMTALASFVPSPVSDVMKAMSVFDRYDGFSGGVFDLTGVVYYISVAAVFLFMTVQSMEKRRYGA